MQSIFAEISPLLQISKRINYLCKSFPFIFANPEPNSTFQIDPDSKRPICIEMYNFEEFRVSFYPVGRRTPLKGTALPGMSTINLFFCNIPSVKLASTIKETVLCLLLYFFMSRIIKSFYHCFCMRFLMIANVSHNNLVQ